MVAGRAVAHTQGKSSPGLCVCQALASVTHSGVAPCPGEPAQATRHPAGQRTAAFPQCNATRPRAAAGVSSAAERRCQDPAWPGVHRPVRVSCAALWGLPGLVGVDCSPLPSPRLGVLQRHPDSGVRRGDGEPMRHVVVVDSPEVETCVYFLKNARPWS